LNDIVVGVAESDGRVAAGAVTTMITLSVCVPEDETITIEPVQMVPAPIPD